MLNEVAQWAVLVFLAIFVMGLTRQLGKFLLASHPAERLAAEGPVLGEVATNAVITPEERDVLQQLREARQTDWLGVVAMDQTCRGCQEMLDHLTEVGVPERAPLMILSRSSDPEHRALLEEVADLVVVDEGRFDKARLGVTPFSMLFDAQFRLMERDIATNFGVLLERWRDRDRQSAALVTVAHASEGQHG